MSREYNSRVSQDEWAELDRGQDCLQYMFRLHLQVAGANFEKDL